MEPNYFSFLPSEIIEIILYSIDNEDLSSFYLSDLYAFTILNWNNKYENEKIEYKEYIKILST